MKKFMICLKCVFLIATASLVPLRISAAGRLEVLSPAMVELGNFPDWEERAARLPIRNAGDAPLAITRVLLTCSCMRVDAWPKTLAPGERGEVVVAIRAKSVFGRFERVFYLLSDDPENPQAKVTLTGQTVPLFAVACDAPTMLGKVDAGHVWTGRYTVVAGSPGVYLEAPRTLNMGATSEFEIRTNCQEKISYTITRVVTFQDAERLESALVFPVGGAIAGAQPPPGGYPPVRLTVAAAHRQRVRALPGKLRIAVSGKLARKRILLVIEDGDAPEIAHLQCSSDIVGVRMEPKKNLSGTGFHVDVTLDPDAQRVLRSTGSATLRFRYKKWPEVEVRLLSGE